MNFDWNQILKLLSTNTLNVTITDIIEICILSFIIYHIMIWIKTTKAWTLLKGFAVLLLLLALAALFHMNTILWIARNFFSLGITAILIVFQPELRKALEQIGENNFLTSIVSFEQYSDKEAGLDDHAISEVVKACFEMGRARTGALMVFEQTISLKEFERTGIPIDSLISSQLILNIFEKNTPLHDGAVIIAGDRIRSATCYLPLSENMNLSKALGTRHRAAVGISEVSDSLTIVVSEETGSVSAAKGGNLTRNLNQEQLKELLTELQVKTDKGSRTKIWKGLGKHEDKTAE